MVSKKDKVVPRHLTVLGKTFQMVLYDPTANRKTVTDGVEHLIADMVEEKGIDRGRKTEVASAIAEEHGIL